MSKPIYQLWMIRNQPTTSAYDAMSEAQQKAFWEAHDASSRRVGSKDLLACECTWANEDYSWWGITQFPDVAARMEHTRDLQKIGWFRITNSFSLMGIPDIEPKAVTFPNPIYQLWVVKNNPVAWQNQGNLSKDEQDTMMAKHNASLDKFGSFVWLYCDSFWCDDAYPNFGVNVYPSIEAEQYHKAELAKMQWGKFSDAFAVLGTPTQM